jgi:hypothetical protein
MTAIADPKPRRVEVPEGAAPGQKLLGVQVPIVIGIGGLLLGAVLMLLGAVLMLLAAAGHRDFFRQRPEVLPEPAALPTSPR